jgi:hypothetical protein
MIRAFPVAARKLESVAAYAVSIKSEMNATATDTSPDFVLAVQFG